MFFLFGKVLKIIVLMTTSFQPDFLEVESSHANLLENINLHEDGFKVILMVSIFVHEVNNGTAVTDNCKYIQIPLVSLHFVIQIHVPNSLWRFLVFSILHSIEKIFGSSFLSIVIICISVKRSQKSFRFCFNYFMRFKS
jgi:hypothetical protein